MGKRLAGTGMDLDPGNPVKPDETLFDPPEGSESHGAMAELAVFDGVSV